MSAWVFMLMAVIAIFTGAIIGVAVALLIASIWQAVRDEP